MPGGRPPKPPENRYRMLSLKVPPEVADWLDQTSEATGMAKAEIIRQGLALWRERERRLRKKGS